MVITLVPGGLGGDVFTGTPGKGIIAKVEGADITAEEVRDTARQNGAAAMPSATARWLRRSCHF